MDRHTDKAAWARHYSIVLIVFAITGSLAVILGRVLLRDILGLEGSFWGGPWSYRVAYLALIPPSYSIILVAVGTLFGKRRYFTQRVLHIWGRPLRLFRGAPRPEPVEQPHDR